MGFANMNCDLSIAELHHHFRLQGGDLFWKTVHPRKRRNAPAGHKRGRGEIFLQIDGHRVAAHRVVFAMTHGRWPQGEVDHINGDPGDNRPENLREVTHSENMWNCARNVRNTSGVKGVSWNRLCQKWEAYVEAHGKRVRLGLHDDLEFAALIVAEARARLHGEFARAA